MKEKLKMNSLMELVVNYTRILISILVNDPMASCKEQESIVSSNHNYFPNMKANFTTDCQYKSVTMIYRMEEFMKEQLRIGN